MSDYLAFIYGGIEQAESSASGAYNDGRKLAEQCLDQLNSLDTDRFPPKLLILLVTPGYIASEKASKLIDGIHRTFDSQFPNVNLIGCSVAAVFFRRNIYPEGALLICLASRLLDVSVESALIKEKSSEDAARELLEKLGLDSSVGEDPNPFANRTLFTFFPGNHGAYHAESLHDVLRERLRARIPIVGGVSSGYDGRKFRPGIQFAQRTTSRDLLVAACVTTETLMGMSVGDQLDKDTRTLRITAIEADRRTVKKFDGEAAAEVVKKLQRQHKFIVLGHKTFSGEPVIEMPVQSGSAPTIRLLREAELNDTFRVLKVNPGTVSGKVTSSIERSCNAIGLSKPAGCLGFRCSGYFSSQRKTGISLYQEIVEVENLLNIENNYVGGFVDGEAGRDLQGRSHIRMWSTAAVVFGDELRHRTSFQRAFEILAAFLSRNPSEGGPQSSVDALLQMIYEIGFPGVRVALTVEGNNGEALVTPNAYYAIGSLALTDNTLPLYIPVGPGTEHSKDPLAIVAYTNAPKFFAWDGKADTSAYYVVPLRTIAHTIIGVLQIDIGKTGNLRSLESRLLLTLGIVVSASLTRIFNWMETEIRKNLQEGLKYAISAANTEDGVAHYVAKVLNALDLRMGHVRTANRSTRQMQLYAGRGAYFEAAMLDRSIIGFADVSHTTSTFQRHGQKSTTIINDAQNDRTHHKLIQQAENHGQHDLKRVLERVGSYANVRFESEQALPPAGHDKIEGTINLLSEDPWFFKYPQRKVLSTISDQLGFLISHLEQKKAERNARQTAERERERVSEAREREAKVNRRLEFLLNVTPQLADQKLVDFEGTLTMALDRICTSVDATVGSIYLWDIDRGLYVLRAQHGWKEPNWVNTATYTREACWFAARELNGDPLHERDLSGYYERRKLNGECPSEDSMQGGLYAEKMFGEKLSAISNVEVIGLPLRMGQKEIGVVALYRRIANTSQSGFAPAVVDMVAKKDKVLTDAASSVSGLIEALLQHQDDETDTHEERRRKRISDEISRHIEVESEESFPRLICCSVLNSYDAAYVAMYEVTWEEPAAALNLRLIDREGQSPPQDNTGPEDPYLLNAAQAGVEAVSGITGELSNCSFGAPRVDARRDPALAPVMVRRRELRESERNNPTLTANEGLVERVCLPLFLGPRCIWLLDLHWKLARPRTYAEEARLREKHLRQLVDDLAKFSRLWTQTERRIAAEKEAVSRRRQQQELQGKLGVIAQIAHEWHEQIEKFEQSLEESKDGEPVVILNDIADQLRTARNNATLTMEMAAKESQSPRAVPIHELIAYTTELAAFSNHAKGITIDIYVPEELKVLVAKTSMQLAFKNLMMNAADAAKRAATPRISIRADVDLARRLVDVSFTNNGRQIEAFKRDAINNGRHGEIPRYGLSIAACFATQYDKGDLKIRTPQNGDTEVVMTLPLA